LAARKLLMSRRTVESHIDAEQPEIAPPLIASALGTSPMCTEMGDLVGASGGQQPQRWHRPRHKMFGDL
jgi:hypothetical protein